MSEYNSIPQFSAEVSERNKFVSRTYSWMGLALLVSAASAFLTALSPALMKALFGNGGVGMIILAVGELALVWWLSASIRSMSVTAASVAFVAYSVINGMTLSSIFWVYQITSIAYCFVAAAGMFFAMSLYGAKTKKDLTSAARYLMMAVIGIMVASLINMLISLIAHQPLTMLDWLISFATVVVFTGLTAYDTQRMMRTAAYSTGSDDYKKVSIIAALELYLDFINIFLSLLRLFGRRNN